MKANENRAAAELWGNITVCDKIHNKYASNIVKNDGGQKGLGLMLKSMLLTVNLV